MKNQTIPLTQSPLYRQIVQLLPYIIPFGQLIKQLWPQGDEPQVHESCDHNNKRYWYAYYPLSGISKVLAYETEIQQWLELRQDI